MFHPGTLHATMFVSCAQRIVASCFIVVIVACVAPAQRHAHGRIRHAGAYNMQHAARIIQPAAHRPRYNNTAATPAALPSASTRQPSLSALPSLMPNPHARTHHPIARLPHLSGDAALSAALRRRSMPAVYLLLYRAVPHALPPVMASTSGKRERPTIRGHKCTDDFPMERAPQAELRLEPRGSPARGWPCQCPRPQGCRQRAPPAHRSGSRSARPASRSPRRLAVRRSTRQTCQ
jgi:hypothetical protein